MNCSSRWISLLTELDTTRSAFIRGALQAALKKHRKKLLERKHAQGYSQIIMGAKPVTGAMIGNVSLGSSGRYFLVC